MMEGFSVSRGPVPMCLAVPCEMTFRSWKLGHSVSSCCLSSFPVVTGDWGSGLEARQPWTLSWGWFVDMEKGWVELKILCTTAIFQNLQEGNEQTHEIHLHTWPSLTAARHGDLHRARISFQTWDGNKNSLTWTASGCSILWWTLDLWQCSGLFFQRLARTFVPSGEKETRSWFSSTYRSQSRGLKGWQWSWGGS